MSEMPSPDTPRQVSLRELPLPARLVLSLFLISAGISYFYGLMQVHFQDAGQGELLPDNKAQREKFAGVEGVGLLERMVVAPENKPFGAGGTMKPAFTTRSLGWRTQVGKVARDHKLSRPEGEKLLRAERMVELDALLAWIHAGAKEEDYKNFELPEKVAKTEHWDNLEKGIFKQQGNKRVANIDQLMTLRCARCHCPQGDPPADAIHLDNYQAVKDYLDPERGGMSLKKRAQTTHVHAFGFSMLYALTGLILAFSTYPILLRVLLCPLPLLAMVLELACWWLPLANPLFADFVEPLAILTATGLMLHIVLSLLNMYGVAGKLILLLMFVGIGGGGGFLLKSQVIDPYLEREKPAVAPAAKP